MTIDTFVNRMKSKGNSFFYSLVEKVFQHVGQDLTGKINSTLMPLVYDISASIQKMALDSCQTWARINDNDVPILPDNTKYYATSNEVKVVVLEYKPQVRSVMFNRRFESTSYRREEVDKADNATYRLAFPYAIIILKFWQGKFSGIYIYYRNEPLTSVDDMLFTSNFPNISGAKSAVCMGTEFGTHVQYLSGDTNFCKLTEYVVKSFWGTAFNPDYVCLMREGANLDPRLATVLTWEQATKEDPFFMLKIPWAACMRLSDFINLIVRSTDKGLVELHENMKQAAVVEISKLTDKLRQCIMEVVEGVKPHAYSDVVKAKMTSLFKDILEREDW